MKTKIKMEQGTHPEALYPYEAWRIREESYSEKNHQRNESVFALGNGYIGLRGNFEEGYHGTEGTSVTGNYLNGFYDSEPIHYPEGAYGYPARNHAMLNVPDAKIVRLEIEGYSFSLQSGTVHKHSRELDMKGGLLHRLVEWESPAGHRVRIQIRRLVSLERKHLASFSYEVTALNFDGEVRLISMINGEVAGPEGGSQGDPRVGARRLEPSLLLEESGRDAAGCWMKHRTRHTGFALVTGIRHSLEAPGEVEDKRIADGPRKGIQYVFPLESGETARLTKFIAYHTSRDYPEEELTARNTEVLAEAEERGFEALAAEQRSYLERFWSRGDVEIQGDPALQQGMRFNAFGLLQSVGRDGVTNIGAKGLTGEGYEGHYFWDTEMYMLPFFTFTQPEIARALLEFRYATLDKARERAAEMSQKGALYPWRTIAGEENSAYFPAGTAQAHINADIAYGIRQYVLATGDVMFLAEKGAEILFETSRFWADLGHFNPARGGAFCIDAVTGPDEYTAIVNNNAYTNLMVREQLKYACETVSLLQKSFPEHYGRLQREIGLTETEVTDWKRAADLMFIPFDVELGIYAQDDTFLSKKKWDFAGTPADKYPLLLHYHPLVIYRHQVLKQADFVMATFLLGDRFSLAEKIRNYRYYEPLTTHDSSLSPCIHSIVSAEIGDLEGAYNYFNRTVRMDLDDVNKNVKDGLHTAAMAGSWMSVVNGFGGLRLFGDGMLSFSPSLPPQWESCRFKVTNRGRLLEVCIGRDEVGYTLLEGEAFTIRHKGELLHLPPGKKVAISLAARLEAVVFDLDGVITDTAEYHYLAWKELADELGIPFDRNVNERLKGVSRSESLDILLEKSGRSWTAAEKEDLAARKNDRYRRLIGQLTPGDLLPGIRELLTALCERGIAAGLASASHNAPLILERLDAGSWFQAVADPAGVTKGKPDPEIFLRAAELLGVPPENCVGVEDAAAGIAAINAAGMKAVGIGSADRLSGTDLLLASTAELSAERLLALFR
ncbi:alpha,alpha-trehalose phosphorylase [Fontibacillus phaseoli]|uniref:Alpha,alpha-trehalose phosphorylase n=1 Tax=Fontibacillus phaseoli TaxID=1416533 RepID=A0A369BH91_9BACL|nr:beta-phosphoglucomutase [Fontibacillus phaseoli]RCX20635.1 alpha,alpha-trehalose phosphorylase [Fontibacillus phaseoli]